MTTTTTTKDNRDDPATHIPAAAIRSKGQLESREQHVITLAAPSSQCTRRLVQDAAILVVSGDWSLDVLAVFGEGPRVSLDLFLLCSPLSPPMSRALRCLKLTSVALDVVKPRSALRTLSVSARRRSLHTTPSHDPSHTVPDALPVRPASTFAPSAAQSGASTPMADYLNTLFAPLVFPPELAQRTLTHMSHKEAVKGHNARLSFMVPLYYIIAAHHQSHLRLEPLSTCILSALTHRLFFNVHTGRRIMNAYLHLFVHSTPTLASSHNYETLGFRALNTYILGEFVGPQWKVADMMRWTPAREVTSTSADDMRSIGFYKVQGTVVEAVVGGVFHQYVRAFLSHFVLGRTNASP
ncbi:hypothetical protein EW146_g5159 [Bondarzewia mesenterica]|uniref:RNase III domain-containing protein n=1 Tax=Bondarzewia mesenterica TaxID=1095465 RepID=A0A4S4LSB5_9AGAM|nr:hypothetical protein EW146_g5159 [Bondarzewia mesenterica]